jgi:CheY-like chemotaxis protein
MSHNGPILIIDDSAEEQKLVKMALEHLNLPNTLMFFDDGKQALQYLLKEEEDKPFMILCDISMPVMNGIELREEIIKNPFLKQKSVPFIFRTSSIIDAAIAQAYELTVQGVFEKPSDYHDLEVQIGLIIEYWKVCLHPPLK